LQRPAGKVQKPGCSEKAEFRTGSRMRRIDIQNVTLILSEPQARSYIPAGDHRREPIENQSSFTCKRSGMPAMTDGESAGPFDLYRPLKPGDAFNCISK
jgi:hypothetical protein